MEAATVSRKLLRYKTEMSDKESGKHDKDHIGWKKSISKKKGTKEENHDFFSGCNQPQIRVNSLLGCLA